MTHRYEREMVPGTVFGSLTVVFLRRGVKNKAPAIRCVCECGTVRDVRPSSLRNGNITTCARCALVRGWSKRVRNDNRERKLLSKETEYRSNAKSRGLAYALDRYAFRALFASACTYCGETPASGIDRRNNREGYVPGNAVPCCADCNFAKRTMAASEFLSLVKRIYEHSFRRRPE